MTIRYHKSSVADPECLSCIPDPIFSIPDPGSRVKKIPEPRSGSASASKNVSILTQNIVSKLSEIVSKIFIPDLGVNKAPDPGSGSATLHKRKKIQNAERIVTNVSAYGTWPPRAWDIWPPADVGSLSLHQYCRSSPQRLPTSS